MVSLNKKKIAIIGASYLQEPLIQKAKKMGLETHVFAWAAGDVGEKSADFFYPYSIVEKDQILEKCREIGIDGICTIASDLAVVTVNYVANRLGLTANDDECTLVSTNKYMMRKTFEANGDPSPKYYLLKAENIEEVKKIDISFPAIVKPTDRSGSRGITKITCKDELIDAVNAARKEGFSKEVLVEEFAEGDEYSVEYISYEGKHHFLNITKKYTTGAPHFIETGHIEPAPIDDTLKEKIKGVVEHALDSLSIKYGASHSELKVNNKVLSNNGNDGIKIIEIAGRMGGDFIGSSLVELSTGFDFVKGVIDVSLGNKPEINVNHENKVAGVRFIFGEEDVNDFNKIKEKCVSNSSIKLIDYEIDDNISEAVTDSSNRHGYFILCTDSYENIRGYFNE